MKEVLVVDDQADLRCLVRWTLEATGADVLLHEAADGESGLRLALDRQPDVVLLDVMLPGAMSGLDVCRQIRRAPALTRTQVILLSARGQADDIQAGLDAGAALYIVKPFSPQQLLDSVEQLLSK